MVGTKGPNVLVRLLTLIDQDGLHSPNELACRLQVSDSLVQQMLATLTTGGYLQRAGSDCPSHCHSCQERQACLVSEATVWRLSDKGRQAIRQWK
jgi:hypothetical protein